MALFINVDPVAPHWWKRRVYRGWQFGYSGGTKNDFMIDIEVARWRFACYIGFKRPQNPGPRQERHEQWRKEQERARERAHKPQSAFQALFRRWIDKAARYRMGKERSQEHQTPSDARQLVDPIRELRFKHPPHDDHNQRRSELAARPSVSWPVHGDASKAVEGIVLREEHQGAASHDHHQKEPDAGGLSREKST